MRECNNNVVIVQVSNDNPKWKNSKFDIYDDHIINNDYRDDQSVVVALSPELYKKVLKDPSLVPPLTDKDLDKWCQL